MQRQAAHVELLLGLLKIIVGDAQARRPMAPEWLGKAESAIGRGGAILEDAGGPDDPSGGRCSR
ncbi:hypothetical protein [Mesorhizobium sangaii]|uniref:hypothetical protein n=1 Tax=Mesorhizobium sangaii TaxID=505389 RepID=UPI001FE836AB|nr:hypothetical protein [Mesorhizobium sangaii]